MPVDTQWTCWSWEPRLCSSEPHPRNEPTHHRNGACSGWCLANSRLNHCCADPGDKWVFPRIFVAKMLHTPALLASSKRFSWLIFQSLGDNLARTCCSSDIWQCSSPAPGQMIMAIEQRAPTLATATDDPLDMIQYILSTDNPMIVSISRKSTLDKK